ncbi:hypothetical protein HMPREF2753_00295 [Neisseria sp. HMSC071C03]|nr:hypothetical protein HMPREF2753_00295 [Neisseria sp. HMSC071C03]
MPRLSVLSVLSAASSPCPDLNLIHYINAVVKSTVGKVALMELRTDLFLIKVETFAKFPKIP